MIFLDIQMEGMGGIEAARVVPEKRERRDYQKSQEEKFSKEQED
jgi:CheY-like chemotaxis protein